jgi:putative nucleotidyltransferase with HDIG domain
MKYSNIREQINKFHKILTMDSDQSISEMNKLADNGVLFTLIPEFAKFKTTIDRDGFTYKNILDHSLRVYAKACKSYSDPLLRFTALVHDIGKSVTRRFVEGKGWNFHGHDKVGSKMIVPIMKTLRFNDDDVKVVSTLIALHMRPMKLFSDSVTDSAVRRLITLAGDQMPRLMELCICDITTNNEESKDIIISKYQKIMSRIYDLIKYDELRLMKISINGNMIMEQLHLLPGEYITEIKNAFKKSILDGKVENSIEAGHKFIEEYSKLNDLSKYAIKSQENS